MSQMHQFWFRDLHTFLCTFSFRKISVASRRWALSRILCFHGQLFSLLIRCSKQNIARITPEGVVLLRVESQQRQIKNQRQPVSVDKEEESQEAMNGGFRDDISVETMTQFDGINVVTVDMSPLASYSEVFPRTISSSHAHLSLSKLPASIIAKVNGQRVLTTPDHYTW